MGDNDRLSELQRKLANAESEWAGWQRNKNGAANAAMAKRLVDGLRAEIAALVGAKTE